MTAEPVKTVTTEPIPTSQEKQPTDQQINPVGALVGLNEANRLTGTSKETILKYAKEGKISRFLNQKGNWEYQVVDLERIWGFKKKVTGQDNSQSNHIEPVGEGRVTALEMAQLQGEKAVLEAQLAAERDKSRMLEEAKEKAEQNAQDWKNQADSIARMLTYQPQPVVQDQASQPAIAETQPAAPEPKKKWWQFGSSR